MTDKRGEPGQESEPTARRIPIQRQIELRFPHFQGLVTGMSSNLSSRGMFIQSDNPESFGTEFTFQLRIEDWSPIQGTARVVWTRPRAEGPDRPAGMGVEFVDVDAQSRRMIHWLVERHVQGGGRPFDIGTSPTGAARLLTELAEMDSATATRGASLAVAETARSPGARGDESNLLSRLDRAKPGRSRIVLGVAIVIVAILSAYLLWVNSRPGSRPLRRGRAIAEADGAAASASTPGERQGTSDRSTTSARQPSIEAITAVVQNWASAWESRQARQLLALYCPDFEPQGDRTRQQWSAEIERKMHESDFIRVAVSGLEISLTDSESATASFYRSFRSNEVDASGRVILELEATDEGWKIHHEQGSI